MTYGNADGVGALSALYSDNGSFTVSTSPTLAVVNGWLSDVSQLLDTALADEGFTVPVTDTDVTGEFALLVEGIVKDLVNYSHNAGRFFSKKYLESGLSPFMTIEKELHDWVKRKTVGLEALGLAKSETGRNVATFDLL